MVRIFVTPLRRSVGSEAAPIAPEAELWAEAASPPSVEVVAGGLATTVEAWVEPGEAWAAAGPARQTAAAAMPQKAVLQMVDRAFIISPLLEVIPPQ